MKKVLLIFILFLSVQNLFGQFFPSGERDTTLGHGNRGKLYRWDCSSAYTCTESTIGIVPSIQGINELYLGLGISKGYFTWGEMGGGSTGVTLGADFNLKNEIWGPKFNLWYNPVIFGIIGLTVGVNGQYYIKGQQSNFVLRPEIGIGYLKVFLNYGRNYFLKDDFSGLSRHTISLSYYQTILPFKTKNKKHHEKFKE